MAILSNIKIAILTADGFEEVEFTKPKAALEEAGAAVEVVSLKEGSVRAKQGDDWSKEYPVDKAVDKVSADDYDALMLPGGVVNPDKLRVEERALDFVRAFFEKHKPVAAICHGPQVLISAQVVEGRKMTGYKAIRQDLINAGAQYEDKEVVVDQGLVTSRKPDDIPAFNRKMIEEFAEGKHDRLHA